jgi:hypothetical protein
MARPAPSPMLGFTMMSILSSKQPVNQHQSKVQSMLEMDRLKKGMRKVRKGHGLGHSKIVPFQPQCHDNASPAALWFVSSTGMGFELVSRPLSGKGCRTYPNPKTEALCETFSLQKPMAYSLICPNCSFYMSGPLPSNISG